MHYSICSFANWFFSHFGFNRSPDNFLALNNIPLIMNSRIFYVLVSIVFEQGSSDSDQNFQPPQETRSRNYVFPPNAQVITSGTSEQNVIAFSFGYENWNPKYKVHINNIVVNEMQKFSCLKLRQQDEREKMPRAPALSPVLHLRRLRKPGRCHAKLENRAMNVYLHEQWCFTKYKIITAFLEALGMQAEKLEREENVIYKTDTLDAIVNHIDTRPEFRHVYAMMPRNYEQYAELIAYCYLAMDIGLDELQPAIITALTWKNLNEKYCSSACPKLKCQNGGMPEVKTCMFCLCPQAYTGWYCENFEHQTGVRASEMCHGSQLQAEQDSRHLYNKFLDDGRTVDRQRCQWLLNAPEGRYIQFNFSFYHHFYYNCTKNFVCRDYLEVRIAADLSLDGFRFCCNGPETMGKIYRNLVSQSNKMLIISRIRYPGTTGFFANFGLTPRKKTQKEINYEERERQWQEILQYLEHTLPESVRKKLKSQNQQDY